MVRVNVALNESRRGPVGVDVADAPEGLLAIHHLGCAAAIWQRDPLPSFQSGIDALEPESLPKAHRLAVAHYGDATLWKRGERRWKPEKIAWKGLQGAILFSLIGYDRVFAGYADGCVLVGRPSTEGEITGLAVNGSSGTPVSALALTPNGWLL